MKTYRIAIIVAALVMLTATVATSQMHFGVYVQDRSGTREIRHDDSGPEVWLQLGLTWARRGHFKPVKAGRSAHIVVFKQLAWGAEEALVMFRMRKANNDWLLCEANSRVAIDIAPTGANKYVISPRGTWQPGMYGLVIWDAGGTSDNYVFQVQ